MAGLSDYLAQKVLNFAAGSQSMPTLPSVFLALFTTAPTSDAGTGGTEVSTSATAYARVQVAGQVTAAASWAASATTITLSATVPSWVTVGMTVFDLTKNAAIATVAAGSSGTTLNITAAATGSTGTTDSLSISAFSAASASSGTEPSVTPANILNASTTITFPQATGNWGTVTSWGLYDASTSGNLLWWDYLGNFAWLPFTGTSASPSVLTSPAHGYANGDPVVVTTKFGGTLPTTAGSWAGVLTVAGAATDSFNVAVNTTSTGDGQVRKIVQQSIPTNVTASFAGNNLKLTLA